MENPYEKKLSITNNKEKVWYARASFGKEEKDAVLKCMDEFMLAPGKYTYEFEKKVAKLYGKKRGVMVNSGSSALLAVAELLDIKPGDEIVTTGSGFPTTINPFLLKGAKVRLVDIDHRTLSPDLNQLESAITSKTKAVIIAHIWGALNDMQELRKITDRNGVYLIEDSCDSIGQTIDGKPSGEWSDISVTSFFPSHVITACGGGGMIMVNSDKDEKKLRVTRDWGRTGTDSEDLEDRFNVDLDGIKYDAKFFYGEMGYNLKATEVQAAFGLEQLKKVSIWNNARRVNYSYLSEIVSKLGSKPIKSVIEHKSYPSWLAFPFLVNSSVDRIDLAKYLEKNDIQTRPILAGNFLRHPAYKKANIEAVYPLYGCDVVTNQGLGIGLHQGIDTKQIKYIDMTFKKYFE